MYNTVRKLLAACIKKIPEIFFCIVSKIYFCIDAFSVNSAHFVNQVIWIKKDNDGSDK